MRKRNIYLCIILILFFMVTAPALRAQVGRGEGRIKGTATDEEGNPLAGVKVVAEHVDTKIVFETSSNKRGDWSIGGLGTGIFRITASKEGFNSDIQEMKVSQFSSKNPRVELVLRAMQADQADMLAIQDEAAMALFKEGAQFFEAKNFTDALVTFEKFSEQFPSFYQIHVNIGNCYKELEEYDKAIASFQLVLDKVQEEEVPSEENELVARAMSSMGETYIKQGELDKAKELLTKALEMFPDDETLAFNTGELFFAQGDTDNAINCLKIANQIRPNWGPPYRQLGYAYLNKGEYQLSLDNFNKFLELSPDTPQASTIKALLPNIENLIK